MERANTGPDCGTRRHCNAGGTEERGHSVGATPGEDGRASGPQLLNHTLYIVTHAPQAVDQLGGSPFVEDHLRLFLPVPLSNSTLKSRTFAGQAGQSLPICQLPCTSRFH